MMMETPVEYFYGETLRWSFGFENPNKAAVIFACAVPLLWCLWQLSWKLQNLWLKIPALLVTAAGVMGAWYCLIMTFSRGGLVAAAAALVYVLSLTVVSGVKRKTPWKMCGELWFSGLLLLILSGATIWNGLGARSTEALGNDASVGNRVELWSGALQMAADNVHGFGAGKSGEQYMQWYQPLERSEGYRTMVNSYLTFLVERGWLWSVGLGLGFGIFWVWTRPLGGERFVIGLRSCMVAFLVAGIFSTTMEDGRLWMLPVGCGVVLAGMALFEKRRLEKLLVLRVGFLVLMSCVALLGFGVSKSHNDPLKREFTNSNGSYELTALVPRTASAGSLGCLLDETVMGDSYAKLLREMATDANVTVLFRERVKDADRVLCAGKSVHGLRVDPVKELILLAPEKVTPAELDALSRRGGVTRMLLPEIDEDGRVGFWEDVAEGARGANFERATLSGVGNRVDSAWAGVIEMVKIHGGS